MRNASLVLICYVLMLVTGVLWWRLPIGPLRMTPPDLAALTAGYLGLTARRGIGGPVAAAVVRGLRAGRRTIWVPGALRVVFAVFRHLPGPVWRRMPLR